MKIIIYKLILTTAVICSIAGLSTKINLRSNLAVETDTLTLSNFGLNSHSHDAPSGSSPAPSGSSPSPSGSSPAPSGSSPAPAVPGTNATNVVGALSLNVIVGKMPYEITKCDQVIQLDAQRISNYDDYTTRAPAFFTMSAYLVNMFESKDNNKLMESINLAHIRVLPSILQGSKTCMFFQDSVNQRNASLCLNDKSTYEAIEKAYGDLMTCRMGGDLKSFDAATINNVLTASCNGFNATAGVKFDFTAIKNTMIDELTKAGFDVSDTTTSGSATFGVVNNTMTNSANATLTRTIDYRVPGTY